jgi:photosystem II stability/assembly factor-like uncharacterized protein
MRALRIKTLLGGLVLLAVVLACSVVSPTTSNVPSVSDTAFPIPAATATATQVPATATPAILSAPIYNSPSIHNLDMLDVNNGWALTDRSVLRTTDGGTTWHNVTPAGWSAALPASPFFLDNTTAWLGVMGADPTSGTLCRTTNGGLAWNSVAVPFGGGSLHFTDPMHGWEMVGLSAGMFHQAVAVYRTGDGGATWNRVFINDPNVSGSSDSLPLVGDKNGLAALDANHGWVTGVEPTDDLIYIYMTQDGGTSWTQQSVSLPAGYSAVQTDPDLPVFFGASEAVLPVQLLGNTNAADFYVSHDGGQTWNATKPVNQGGFLAVASASDFFVWDGGSKLKVSHDAGASWSTVTPNLDIQDRMVSMQFVNASTGWVLTDDASSHRMLYQTTDGGANWTPLIP